MEHLPLYVLSACRELTSELSQVDANEKDHARFRRLLAHAFSEKALRDQEPILQTYVSLLISRMHELSNGPAHGVADMVRRYSFV